MTRSTRRLAACALAFLVAASVAACSGDSTLGGDTQASGEAGKVNLSMWAFDPEPDFLPEVKKRFEATHPDITINVTQIPEDQYPTKMTTAFVAGETPDVAAPYDPSWIKSGEFLPIDDALSTADVPAGDAIPSIAEFCILEGKTYCYGTYAGAVALFYNKDMFDEAGIPYPSSTVPMSIDEYASVATQLSQGNIRDIASKVFGGSAPVPFYWMDHALTVDSDGRKTEGVVDSARTAHVYDTLGSMLSEGSAPSESILQSLGGGTADSPDLMAQGKQAMVIADTVVAIPLLEKQKIHYGVAPSPVAEGGDLPYLAGYSDAEGVLAASKHPEEAAEFVAFLATEGNEIRAEQGAFPLRTSVAESSGWATKGDATGRGEFLELAKAESALNFIVPGFFEWTAPLSDVLAAAERGDSAQPLLKKSAPRMQADLDDAWARYDESN